MLGKLPNYSELTTVPFGFYNSMSSANKAIIDTALLRPVIYTMLDNSNTFERRTWATTGEVYMGYYLDNGAAVVVFVIPDNIYGSYQGSDCIYSSDKYCNVAAVRDYTFDTTLREGYYYRVYRNTAPFVSGSSYMPQYNNLEEILLDADSMFPATPVTYPITYSFTNSTVSGPDEAAVGDTVVVSAVPNVDYGITDPTTQIAVTNNDDPVNFTWDASTNRITFVMPDPS